MQDPSLEPALEPAEILPPPPPRLLSPALHRKVMRALDQSLDGAFVLTADANTLKIWNVEQRAAIHTHLQSRFGSHPSRPHEIVGARFTSEPRQVLLLTNQRIYRYDDFDFSAPAREASRFEPFHYHYDREAKRLLSASFDTERLRLVLIELDVETFEQRVAPAVDFREQGLDPALAVPRSFSVDSAGKVGALSFFDSKQPLFLIDLAAGAHLGSLPAEIGPLGILPDGRALVRTVSNGRNAFRALDRGTGAEEPLFSIEYPYAVQVDFPLRPEDPLLLAYGDALWTHDLASGQTSPALRLPGRVADLAISMRVGERRDNLVAQSTRLSRTGEAAATYLERFDPGSGLLRQPWTEPTFAPDAIFGRPDDFEAIARSGDSYRRIRFTETGIASEPLSLPQSLGAPQAAFDSVSDSWIFVGSLGPLLSSVSSKEKAEARALGSARYRATGDHSDREITRTRFFDRTRDGRLIALHHENVATVFDLQAQKRVAEFEFVSGYAYSYDRRQLIAISPDGSTLAYAYTAVTEKGSVDTLECRDVLSGELKWRSHGANERSKIDNLKFSIDGKLLYLTGRDALGRFESLYAATGEPAGWIGGSGLIAYNASGTLVAQASGAELVVKTLPEAKLVAKIPLASPTASMSFIGSDRFLIANSTLSECLQLVDTQAGAVVAEISLFESPQKWLARNAETGLFASEASLQDELKFLQGEQITPLASYFEEYYRPRLLGSLIKGLAPRPAAPVADLRYAPKLKLSIDGPATRGLSVEDEFETFELPTPEVTLALEASCEGSPIADLRVYHNGKLVAGATRGLFVEDDPDAPSEQIFTKSMSQSFTLTPGRNRFRAVAINRQGTESAPDEIIVYSEAAPPESEGGIALHLLVVGINEYRNPSYNLNYALADAKAVESALRKNEATLFSRSNVYTLFDAEATRENLLESLDAIRREAAPRDVFVFYYAGHGVMSDEAEPKFYLAPYDITQLYGEDRILRQLGVSSDALLQYSRDIAAQKQLFILDACQSAGALKTIAQRGAVEEKAIAQLARSSGTHWLTATGSEQFATEFDELGHGVFTHTLLEALSGAADLGDKIVSVNELKAYLEAKVPEVTAARKGDPQYPAAYGYGQDFPLAALP